jgi:ABC-2 type transport system ATP-binding protein
VSDLAVVRARGLSKSFRRGTGETVNALSDVSFEAHQGTLGALVGPDGAGKTTLLRLVAGLLVKDAGELTTLGVDVTRDPGQVQARIGYMPQAFGLYEDLTVQENLDLYADLHGVGREERRERYERLFRMTALAPFTRRLAGRLSGGMKQKLGLACTLVRTPELLLLDEPTAGVDPLSRRELWAILASIVETERLAILVSTSALDEAERCSHAVVLHEGKLLAQGAPGEIAALARGRSFLARPRAGSNARGLQARLLDDESVLDAVPEGGAVRLVTSEGAAKDPSWSPLEPRFEDGFMVLLRRKSPRPATGAEELALERAATKPQEDVVVSTRDLVRRFGDFVAVDHVSFEVHRGEVFGLLGPNGAGKSTTFRMLCGLLEATSGTLLVSGVDLHRARASARQRIGYVAQKFSLYGQLSVAENLDFFASAYGLRGARKRERIAWALGRFDLAPLARLTSEQLPGGFKRRLSMAAALLHEPEILFLDEPTSGADPLARREFWRRITALSEQGITIVVTTHMMEEAEYCDRLLILDAGRVLAQGTPAEVRRRGRREDGREPTMEDAFLAIVEEARARAPVETAA